MTQSFSGIVRDAVVVPRVSTSTGEFRPYVLLTIANNGKHQTAVGSAKFVKSVLDSSDVSVPDVEYGQGNKRITGLIGKAVEVECELTIKGETQYTDSDGNKHTHQRNGMQITKLFVLSDAEGVAYMYSNSLSSGVSQAALEIAAKSTADLMIEMFRKRERERSEQLVVNTRSVSAEQPQVIAEDEPEVIESISDLAEQTEPTTKKPK